MKVRMLFFAAEMFAVVGLHGQANNTSIEVPDGVRVLMQVKGDGTQNYTCTQAQGGLKWVLTGPDAKLLDAGGHVIGTHVAGPTWKLNDGGTVQGVRDTGTPAPEPKSDVEWLRLRAKPGTAAGSLAAVTFIRRTETHGGVPPATGCQNAGDVGKPFAAPYTATYTFYVPK